MTSRHRTYKGKEFNMSAFSEKNADTRAVGNVNMNARGDVLDRKGNVRMSANQISQAFSANNTKRVKQVSLKEDSAAAPVSNKAVKPDTKPEIKPVAQPTPQPVAQPEVRVEAKPTPQPVVQPEVRVEAKPVAQPTPQPEVQVEEEFDEPEIDPSNQVIARREIRTPEGPAYEIEYADGSMEIIPIRT